MTIKCRVRNNNAELAVREVNKTCSREGIPKTMRALEYRKTNADKTRERKKEKIKIVRKARSLRR